MRRRRHFSSFVDRCGTTALCWLQVGRTQQVCQCAIARPSSADRSEARLHGNRSQSSAGEQRWLPSSPPLFIIGDSVPNCSKRTCVVSYARKKKTSSEAKNDVCNQRKLCSRTCYIARTRIPIIVSKVRTFLGSVDILAPQTRMSKIKTWFLRFHKFQELLFRGFY